MPGGELKVTWSTNFTPVKTEKHNQLGRISTFADPETTWAYFDEGDYFIRVWYGHGDGEYVDSYVFFVSVMTVKFDPNGGIVSPTHATVGVDGKLTSLPTPSRAGYSFTGWYSAPSGGSAISLDKVYTEDTTIYAHWVSDYCSITVIDGTADRSAAPIGQTVTITASEKENYTFSGWEVVSGDITLTDPSSSTTTFVMGSEDVTVKANFTYSGSPTEYHDITVIDGTADRSAAPSGQTVTITASEKENYTFSGWEVVSGDITLTDPSSRTTTFDMGTEDVKVKATYTYSGSSLTDLYVFVTEPVGGQHPMEAMVTTDAYRVTDTQWIDTSTGTALAETDEFQAGKTYQLQVIVASNALPIVTTPNGYVNNSSEGVFCEGMGMALAKIIKSFTVESVPASYIVTFDANGHGTAPAPVTVEHGNPVACPADPTADPGWKFAGWCEDKEGTIAYEFSTPVTSDITIYASWTEDGGTPTTYTVTPPSDATVTASSSKQSIGSPTFSDLSNVTEISLGANHTAFISGSNSISFTLTGENGISSDPSIYPQGTDSYDNQNHAYVYIYVSGDSDEIAALRPMTMYVQLDESDLAAAEPGTYTATVNYLFRVYCPDKVDVVKSQTLTLSIEGETPATYTVTFDANGHGAAPTAQTVEDGKTATKPADPAETGWTFGGWYTEAACTNAFDFSTPITADITLFAKWTEDGGPVPVTKYTITYVLNGGTLDGKTGTVTVQAEDGATITLPKPTRSGYTFDYWEGSRYEAGASYKVTGNHTFTAQWKANSTTTSQDTGGKYTSPKTGDESHIGLWFALMILSLIGLGGVTVYRRKKRTHR